MVGIKHKGGTVALVQWETKFQMRKSWYHETNLFKWESHMMKVCNSVMAAAAGSYGSAAAE